MPVVDDDEFNDELNEIQNMCDLRSNDDNDLQYLFVEYNEECFSVVEGWIGNEAESLKEIIRRLRRICSDVIPTAILDELYTEVENAQKKERQGSYGIFEGSYVNDPVKYLKRLSARIEQLTDLHAELRKIRRHVITVYMSVKDTGRQ